MAEWRGTARTNFIKVKDADALIAATADLPLKVVRHEDNPDFLAFFPAPNDSGDFDYLFCDAEDNEQEWDWTDFCEHFVEGQVLVVMTGGGEQMRYVTGHALAIAWDGRTTEVKIDSIYALAAQAFGVHQEAIARATYENLPKMAAGDSIGAAA